MAKAKTRTVYRTVRKATRRRARSAVGGLKGTGMNALYGAVGAMAAQFGAGVNAQYGPAAGMLLVGHVTKNQTLQTLAGMNLGTQVSGMVGGGGGAVGTGWF